MGESGLENTEKMIKIALVGFSEIRFDVSTAMAWGKGGKNHLLMEA